MSEARTLTERIRAFFARDRDGDQWFDRRVPNNERLGLWEPTSVWIGFAIAYVVAFIGAQIYFGLGMPDTIYAIILGNLVLAIYASFIAAASAKGGLNFPLQVKEAFGSLGAIVPLAIMGLLVNGWYAYQAWLAADVIHAAYSIPWVPLAIVITIIFGIPVLIGIEAMADLVEKVVIPLIILGALYMLATRILPAGTEVLNSPPPGDPIPFMVGVSSAWGTFAVSGTMTGDIVRFTDDSKQSIISTVIAFLVFNTGMLLLGALTAAATQELSLYFGMIGVAGSIPIVIIAAMSCWSTCDATLYNATMAYSNITDVITWRVGAVLGIIIATTAAATAIISDLLSWLLVIGLLVPPIGGIIIGDYYLLRREKGYNIARTASIHWPAVVTLIAAIVVNYFVYQSYPQVLFGLPGLLMGVFLYPALTKLGEAVVGDTAIGQRFANEPAGTVTGIGTEPSDAPATDD